MNNIDVAIMVGATKTVRIEKIPKTLDKNIR